jgi:hypothetical protein
MVVDRATGEVRLPIALFEKLLAELMRPSFDPDWYRGAYPDVADGIEAKVVSSELDHFVKSGYLEGRFPGIEDVDEAWYLRTYPDVARAVASGVIASAHVHYHNNGYQEGRAPNPTAAAELAAWHRALSGPGATAGEASGPRQQVRAAE